MANNVCILTLRHTQRTLCSTANTELLFFNQTAQSPTIGYSAILLGDGTVPKIQKKFLLLLNERQLGHS